MDSVDTPLTPSGSVKEAGISGAREGPDLGKGAQLSHCACHTLKETRISTSDEAS